MGMSVVMIMGMIVRMTMVVVMMVVMSVAVFMGMLYAIMRMHMVVALFARFEYDWFFPCLSASATITHCILDLMILSKIIKTVLAVPARCIVKPVSGKQIKLKILVDKSFLCVN